MHQHLACALAISTAKTLDLFMTGMTDSLLLEFAQVLSTTQPTQLENLFIQSWEAGRHEYYFRCCHDDPTQSAGFDDSWVSLVIRSLDLNRERTTSRHVFERFRHVVDYNDQADKQTLPVLFADVFAVSPEIVFELMRRGHGTYGLLQMIMYPFDEDNDTADG